MQIVIDIPRRSYDRIRSIYGHTDKNAHSNAILGNDAAIITRAIICGKVLPKGHGDLKDVKDIVRNNKRWLGYLDEDMIARLDIAVDKHVPTIIEADKGGAGDAYSCDVG